MTSIRGSRDMHDLRRDFERALDRRTRSAVGRGGSVAPTMRSTGGFNSARPISAPPMTTQPITSITGLTTTTLSTGLLKSAGGHIATAVAGSDYLSPSDTTVTKQGNSFNGTSQLVKTTAAGKLPALDGSLLTNLPSTGITSLTISTPTNLTGVLKGNGTTIQTAAAGVDYEAALGNPNVDGKVLASTAAGVRSWVTMSGGDALGNPSVDGYLLSSTTAGVRSWVAPGEPVLGNPVSDGYVLSSTAAGVRSWVAPGMDNPMTTAGDLIYGGTSGAPTRLAGATGFLKYSGSAPAWASIAQADVSGLTTASVPTFAGMTLNGGSDVVKLAVSGASGQTANLSEWRNNSNALMSRIGKAGDIYVTDTGVEPNSSLLAAGQLNGLVLGSSSGLNFVGLCSSSSASSRMVFSGIRCHGTLDSPTAAVSGDSVFSLLGSVYDGTTTRSSAAITFIVESAVSTNVAPQYISVQTGTGGATPRTERWRWTSAGHYQAAEGINIILGTTTGTQIGTSTTQKLAFYGGTPVVRAAAYTQTYSTASRTHANSTYVSPAVGATRDLECRAALDQLAADVLNLKQVVNALIDDQQGYNLAG